MYAHDRRDFLKSMGRLAGALALPGVQAGGRQDKPSFVFILIDDLGWTDLGCFGSDYYETPHIDRLAREGVRFTSAYTSSGVCSPTRASIMTGKYPGRLRLTTYLPGPRIPNTKLLPPETKKFLDPGELALGEAFKESGYETIYIGKWHLGGFPDRHGFGRFHYNSKVSVPGDAKGVHKLTRVAENIMEEFKDKPFLLFLSHYSVHVPLAAGEEAIRKYARKPPGKNGQSNPVMGAMIEEIDQSVGRIMNKIRSLGLEDRTVVIFFSDNGGFSCNWKGSLVTSNRPLRGGKSMLYEGGIRVPLIVKGPGISEPGGACGVPVICNDLYPTMLSMAGLPLRPEQHVDGKSLVPLLKGAATLERKHLFWHYPHYQALPPHGAVRSENYKLIEFYEDDRAELYDLKKDPGEADDLADGMPEKAMELRGLLHRHLKSVDAQMPTVNPEYDPEEGR